MQKRSLTLAMAAAAVWIGRSYFGFLRGVRIEPGLVELLLVVIVPAFVRRRFNRFLIIRCPRLPPPIKAI